MVFEGVCVEQVVEVFAVGDFVFLVVLVALSGSSGASVVGSCLAWI